MSMTKDEQLSQGLDGHPQCPNASGECCPDFSCCKPELLAPIEARRAFINGTEEQRARWLMSFLGAAIAAHDSKKRVYITRGEPEKDSEQ
jgi:hypothetical protein